MPRRRIFIINLGRRDNELERFELQTIPESIGISGETNIATIASLGRNNPFYHFTGGEDNLEFQISWYAEGDDSKLAQAEVVRKCREIRSLSKADGYVRGLPQLAIVCGGMFANMRWILEDAPYRLVTLTQDTGLLPQRAVQSLKFKKVTDHNLTYDELREG